LPPVYKSSTVQLYF